MNNNLILPPKAQRLPVPMHSAGISGSGRREFIAIDWKAFEKNTLRGFCTIVLPSGLRIKECTVHEKNGSRWLGLPGKPWTKNDGTTSYISILDFANDEARTRFQRLALAAVDELLTSGGR